MGMNISNNDRNVDNDNNDKNERSGLLSSVQYPTNNNDNNGLPPPASTNVSAAITMTAEPALSSALSSSAFSSSLFSFCSEMQVVVVELSIPTLIVNLGFVVPYFIAASFIGRRFGPTHFDGYALASLTGNVFQGTLLQGLFNASDTLSPQAFGQNYQEMGLLVLRGYVAARFIIFPLNAVLWQYLHQCILVDGLHQDPMASYYGAQ
ncbi:hypothetical protein ACA910_001587 [Epithemia clementina (nom. ined.)]